MPASFELEAGTTRRSRSCSEASTAIRTTRAAAASLPEVRRYLLREKAKRPEISHIGVTLGGKDQAWIYREEMRDVWLGSPEAMQVIRRAGAG